ncbi:MAG: signal peptidase I [Terracidiphilus sp.]
MTTQKNVLKSPDASPAAPVKSRIEETPFEGFASICSMLVVVVFIYGFLAQNFVIPSGSMENTLLIGDHLVVDRITTAPAAKWMPLVYYREPRRGDVTVFIKPIADVVGGAPRYQYLVKRLIGVPGDRIHLRNGTVYINGVAQPPPAGGKETDVPAYMADFVDQFPAIPPSTDMDATEAWSVAFPNYLKDGNIVVPPGEYFMMGDNRHFSLDSRYWGFVPRANIIGTPLFNYWSFKATAEDYDNTGPGARLRWMGNVALHFFTDTRWNRTFHVIH